MATPGRKSCSRAFHKLVSFVLAFLGGFLFGYGLYLLVSKKYRNSYVDLQSTGSQDVSVHLPRIDIVLVIVGGVMVLFSIVAHIAMSRNCVGLTFRVMYGIFAVVILAAMILVAALYFYILRLQTTDKFKADAKNVWESSVQNEAKSICSVESGYKCRGFENQDCLNCRLGSEATCITAQKTLCAQCNSDNDFTSKGCFNSINRTIRIQSIAIGSASTILALLLFVDLFVLCAL
jgi:Tetraspanin family